MELYRDHTIEGRNIFPGAGFLEMALAAAKKNQPSKAMRDGAAATVVTLDPLPPPKKLVEEGC